MEEEEIEEIKPEVKSISDELKKSSAKNFINANKLKVKINFMTGGGFTVEVNNKKLDLNQAEQAELFHAYRQFKYKERIAKDKELKK